MRNSRPRCKVRLCHGKPHHDNFRDTGEVIERVLVAEVIGNFNPIFCRYNGKVYLVDSLEGDPSDPFRGYTDEIINNYFIDVDSPCQRGMPKG